MGCCESGFKICSLNFRMVYAQNLYIDFLAKFTLRAPCRAGRPIHNLRARFTVVRAIALYAAARLYAFFSLFFASLRTHLRFFPACALRLNSIASLAQSVAAMSGYAPSRRIFARFLRAVARGYFQNFTQNSDEPAPTFAPPS